jgi:ERCC4-type nuclease
MCAHKPQNNTEMMNDCFITSVRDWLQNEEEIGLDIESNNIISKLVLLTQHFPKLRLIWSKSPYETAQIFLSLKENKPEPTESDIPSSSDDTNEDLGIVLLFLIIT